MEELVSLFFGKAKLHLGKAKQGAVTIIIYSTACGRYG
jgi:hypothetical protein